MHEENVGLMQPHNDTHDAIHLTMTKQGRIVRTTEAVQLTSLGFCIHDRHVLRTGSLQLPHLLLSFQEKRRSWACGFRVMLGLACSDLRGHRAGRVVSNSKKLRIRVAVGSLGQMDVLMVHLAFSYRRTLAWHHPFRLRNPPRPAAWGI